MIIDGSSRFVLKHILLLLAIFSVSLVMTSCASKQREYLSATESFHRAMSKFERGKYLDASEDLTVITLNFSGSSIIDSAQYFLGECHYRMKEYIVAASEFERLVNQYPSSPLVDDAKYKIGMCYYKLSPHYGLDQEYSQKCIDEFQEFTEYFPDSELIPEVLERMFEIRSKLARKVYKSGELYYKMKDYESAIIYFDSLLEDYYDTEYAAKALLKKGECLLKLKREEEAMDIFARLQEKYPDSPSAQKARAIINPVKNKEIFPW